MSKIRYFIIFMTLGILWSNPVNAQSSKLQQGIDHFMNGSYEKALVYFNQVIGQELASGPEQMVDACYYRGLTYIRLYNEAYSGDNEDAKNRYKDALLSAYIDFKASLGYDNGSKWKQIDLEIKNLHHALLSEGLSSLNAYNDKVYHGKPDPGLLKRAEDYLVAASEIRETYLVCDLLGQVYLDKGMKGEATDFFSRSERLYTENLPDEPDFLMAYVFYRQAALHKQDDIRLAMQDNQRGLKFMESEYARFSGMKGKLTPGRIQQMEEQYRLAMQDLNNLKLDLYLSDSGQYVEALHVFEEELTKQPENVDILIGYASLLEKSDKEKAVKIYEKALSLDTANAIVLFNLGALHYARGKDLFDTAQETTDDDQFKILMDAAITSFETARPYFEKAFAVDPGSKETIQALKTIAFVLDDQPAYLKYQELENRLPR